MCLDCRRLECSEETFQACPARKLRAAQLEAVGGGDVQEAVDRVVRELVERLVAEDVHGLHLR
jgi:hypothetical protein